MKNCNVSISLIYKLDFKKNKTKINFKIKNMKKIIIICLNVLSFQVHAQNWKVTPEGLNDAIDTTKTYVVLPIENKTAKVLYEESLKYINKNYKNPNEVIKGNIENEYLKFVTYESKFTELKVGWNKIPWNINYTVELNFKDGKVKYEVIEIEIKNEDNYPLAFKGSGISFYIYKKNGELKMPDAKTNIEEYFNIKTKSLSDFLQGKSSEDKW